MSELITGFTALPNLHPALVHFPIALLPTAVLFDLIALRRRPEWAARAAAWLYGLAAAGTGAAYWAGRQAADTLPELDPSIQARVNHHSDSGLYTLWAVVILTALRIGLELWDGDGRRRLARVGLVLVALGGVVLVLRTADLGGGLVYGYGVAVADGGARAAQAAASHEQTMASLGRPVAEVRERPRAESPWRLQPAPGSDLAAVSAISLVESAAGRIGLRLDVQGEALLVLPGSLGDVEVEAELDVTGFSGEVGLAHHVRDRGNAGLFTIEVPAARFALGAIEAGAERELDRALGNLPSGPFRITVSAIGRHLKGLIEGEAVVHGHERPLAEGAAGLLLRGVGTVELLSIRVVPVAG